VASGLSGAAFLLAVFLLVESRRPDSEHAGHALFNPRALRVALDIPSIGLLLLTSFIAVFSFANFESTLSVLIEKIMIAFDGGSLQSPLLTRATETIRGWGYHQREDIVLVIVLAVFAYLGLVLTLAQGFLVRRLAGRLSESTMAVMGGVGAIAGFLLLALATSRNDFGLVLIGLAVEVTGFAFVNPSLQALISRRSDPARQGAILGLAQSAASLARILGPVCGLRLFASSPVWPFWFATALMTAGLLMVLVAARSGRDFVAG
jgi:MFS family permease